MSPLFTKPKHYQNQDKFIDGLTYSDIVQDSNFPNREISKAHVSNNSGNNEWYTPENYIESARATTGRD